MFRVLLFMRAARAEDKLHVFKGDGTKEPSVIKHLKTWLPFDSRDQNS